MRKISLQEVCSIAAGTADAGMPAWANLTSRTLPAAMNNDEFAGGGVYACFWDDRLIYIGSFVGPEGNPFGGTVAERIRKHAIGFTLRARELGFSKRPLASIIANLDSAIATDLEAAYRESNRLEGGAIKATENKARFAAQHWNDLRDATPERLFDRFSFAYRRLPKDPNLNRPSLKLLIELIERLLIQKFEPICNTKHRLSKDGSPVDIDIVAKEFENFFTNPSKPLPVDVIRPITPKEDTEDDDGDDVSIFPEDSRWQEYTLTNGQRRARAVAGKESTLLFQESGCRVICLANQDRLKELGIEPEYVENKGRLHSAVAVEFNGDPTKRAELLRKLLEASLAEWEDNFR